MSKQKENFPVAKIDVLQSKQDISFISEGSSAEQVSEAITKLNLTAPKLFVVDYIKH